MGTGKQQTIPGALTPAEEMAEGIAELRGELEEAKAKYEDGLEDLFEMMVEEGIVRLGARGLVFSIEETKKLKVTKGGQ